MTRKEAIQVVRGLTETTYFDDRELEGLRTLIPELTESEDERIRKELISLVRYYVSPEGTGLVRGGSITRKQAEAWLEKQKEQKPAEWSEADERVIRDACCWIAEYAGFLMSENKDKAEMLWKLSNKLKSLRPQKLDASKLENFDPVEVLHRIKKQWPMAWEKVVPTQGWSEKDEKTLASIIDYLDMSDLVGYDEFIEFEEFLQSLPMRCPKNSDNWKPSEMQLEALDNARHSGGSHYLLDSLYNDLKKL